MKQRRVDVSVCIPNYNGGTYVLECLRSVFTQVTEAKIEVIVHDDASTDNSAALIAASFPEAKLIRSTDNAGFCISNNRMAEQAEGTYLLLLNNDAALRPGSINALWNAARAQTRKGILGLPQSSMIDSALIDRGYHFDIFLNPSASFVEGMRDVDTVTGACLWIPREAWDDVRGFPAWFESVAEDIYLCLSARLLGYSVQTLPAPSFDHWVGKNLGGGKISEASLHTSVRRRRLSERNKTMVMQLLYPRAVLAVVLPLHYLSLSIESLFLRLTGTPADKLAPIYRGIRRRVTEHSREVAELRAHLMAKRAITWKCFFRNFKLVPQKARLLLRYGRPRLD